MSETRELRSQLVKARSWLQDVLTMLDDAVAMADRMDEAQQQLSLETSEYQRRVRDLRVERERL